MKYLITLLFLLFTSVSITTAQVTDSLQSVQRTEQTDTTDAEYEEGGDFGLFVMLMIGLAIICVLIGSGIVITTAALLIIFAMVSFGIISTSLIVGFYKKSLSKGIKTFYILCSMACSTVAGGIGLLIINYFYHWRTPLEAVLLGAAFGLLAGWLVGLITFYILQRLVLYFNSKLKRAL